MTTEFKPKTQPISGVAPDTPLTEAIKNIMTSRIKTFNPWRRHRLIEWNINIAYLCGHQYIGVEGDGHIHVIPEAERNPYWTTANKILPAARNDVAMATKIPPVFDVVPEATDADDRATAIAGDKMSHYIRRLNNFDASRGKIILWYDISGIGWRKNYWDAYYQVVGYNPEPEQEGHDPSLEPGQPIYQGEAVSEVVPTNELIYDWRQNVDKLPWIIHARPMTLSEISIRYGAEASSAIPQSEYIESGGALNEFEVRIHTELNTISGSQGGKIEPDNEQMGPNDKEVMIYEMWQVRDSIYPMGVFSIMAGLDNGVVLEVKPYPIEQYRHGKIPFVGYDMMEIDKAVSGTASRISQARPLQRELNETRTLIRENLATLGGGLWMASRDAKLDIRQIEGGVGLWVEYDSVYKPTREAGVPIPGELFAHTIAITEDIQDIFSFPPVSQGKRPIGGPKSGIGIGLLQETAGTQHSPIINEMDRKDEMAMRQLLSVAFANYGERTFNIVGKDNQWTLFEYDPNSFTTNYNVYVRTGSSLPISKAYEREMTLGLLQTGLLGNPLDPVVRRKALEVIDIGGLDTILKDSAKDTNFARMEFSVPVQQYQMLMQQGMEVSDEESLLKQIYFPSINAFDNHDVHIIEHKNAILDHYFEYLGSGDPGLAVIANSMVLHWAQHAQILQQMQLQHALMTGEIKTQDIEKPETKE
jgi:hypothetical protein